MKKEFKALLKGYDWKELDNTVILTFKEYNPESLYLLLEKVTKAELGIFEKAIYDRETGIMTAYIVKNVEA